ncbi:MAG: sigma-70 family RNA polymerase sigma factor [Verrucomicrobiota bacterium]
MNSLTDQQLLRDYTGHRSEAAFAELVRRHVDFVYSVALRMVRDSHLAEDVTQNAFVALAQNAGQLTDRSVLSGWLHRTAQNIAANAIRSEVRRRAREQEAAAINELFAAEPEATWEHIAPHLDAALGELSEPDRDALLLRYFERKSAREMAQTFGTTEDAAQKRVSRAIERLRDFFSKRNVTVGASALAVLISANAVQAAPVGLAVTIATTAVLAGTAAQTSTVIAATKAIAMTTMQKTITAALLAAAVGTGIYEAHQASRLRDENQSLRQQTAQLKSDNENLSNRVAQGNRSPSLSSERLRELLKLRGEVGALRRQQRELEQAVATAQSKTPGPTGQPASDVTSQTNLPAPFQLQLVLDEPGEDTEPMTNNASGAGGETLHVQKTPLMDYTAIRSATVERDASSGDPEINVELSDVGKELFAAVTKENINKRLAIVLDGHLYLAPVIRSEISDGKVQITGHFTKEEARELAAKINDAIGSH